jgi:hypothetical protein
VLALLRITATGCNQQLDRHDEISARLDAHFHAVVAAGALLTDTNSFGVATESGW